MKKTSSLLATVCIFLITCTSSYAQSIESYFVQHSYDVCGTYTCTTKTSGYAPGQTMKFYWGDGTSDILPVVIWYADTGTSVGHHPYATPGIYTIKAVLYNGAAVDSVSFTQSIDACNFLKIGSRVDINANCVSDSTDEWTRASCLVEIDSAGVAIDTLPMYSMIWYRASAPAGTIYRMRMLSPPPGLALACSTSGIIYDTIPATPFEVLPWKYMLFDCTSTSSAFDLDISASFRSSASGLGRHKARVMVTNTACVGTVAQVIFDYSPKYSFNSIGAALSHTVTGTSVTIDLGTVSAHSLRIFDVELDAVVPLVSGDTANSSFTVTPITGDADPSNNVVIRLDTVTSSYDPNHKTATPSGDIVAGNHMEYMLEFENMGTDTAHNIHILDTLSENLDINTLKGGASTHKVSQYSYNAGGQNILKFDFPNIMLPDSSHHDVCRGMVTFSIDAKTSLLPGAGIANRVGIYFDANEVVMTNTVYNQIPLPLQVRNIGLSSVELFPNPVSETLNVATENGSYKSLAIYNIMGSQVITQSISSATTNIDVRMLAPGIYYLALRGEEGSRTIKFVKK